MAARRYQRKATAQAVDLIELRQQRDRLVEALRGLRDALVLDPSPADYPSQAAAKVAALEALVDATRPGAA